ncbi:MAG TPA: glycerate kinase [Bryobacteraceae bacterium]|nr:glycerate kinase [Bryobacteraceae bacterium]
MRIFRAALDASDPQRAVHRHLHLDGENLVAGRARYPLRRFRRIFVSGAGKAAVPMARAIEELLGKRIAAGSVNTKYGHGGKLRRIDVVECAHPVPDSSGVEGTRRLMDIARSAGRDDLLICLISGGASALTPAPAAPVTLTGKQRTTELLLRSGAGIHEINTVRKHLSEFKGGQLARLAAPATVLSLLLSDVTGDDLDVIGSGPTVPDRSTFEDAVEVMRRRGIWKRIPAGVRARLEQGLAGKIAETPKPGSPIFRRVRNIVVGSNRQAIAAAQREAKELGYHAMILSSVMEGEAREVAGVHAAIAKEILASGHPLRRPACVISGGETTVTLRGHGKGGRNQEFVLSAAAAIAGLRGVAILSGGTDGTDGPTDAAGAIATGSTIERASAAGLDWRTSLDRNDSYHFFDPLGDLIRTGPTRTNVMDVRVILVGAVH